MGLQNKNCSKCGTNKSFDMFRNSARSKDGKKPSCKECEKISDALYREMNKQKVSDARRKWAIENPEKDNKAKREYVERNINLHRARGREWARKNKEKRRKYAEIYYAENRDKVLSYGRDYHMRNKWRSAKREVERRCRKNLATPKWANKFLIDLQYMMASKISGLMGEPYHVDHIVPLKGRNVCGLHVEHNLRVIAAKENLSKSNLLVEELVC